MSLRKLLLGLPLVMSTDPVGAKHLPGTVQFHTGKPVNGKDYCEDRLSAGDEYCAQGYLTKSSNVFDPSVDEQFVIAGTDNFQDCLRQLGDAVFNSSESGKQINVCEIKNQDDELYIRAEFLGNCPTLENNMMPVLDCAYDIIQDARNVWRLPPAFAGIIGTLVGVILAGICISRLVPFVYYCFKTKELYNFLDDEFSQEILVIIDEYLADDIAGEMDQRDVDEYYREKKLANNLYPNYLDPSFSIKVISIIGEYVAGDIGGTMPNFFTLHKKHHYPKVSEQKRSIFACCLKAKASASNDPGDVEEKETLVSGNDTVLSMSMR